ncbi:MAG: hypothetical protein R3F20_00175 [Planctomycetota bacterium]
MWTSFAQSLREAAARRLVLSRGLDALAARAAGRGWAEIAAELSDAECEARADESGILFTPAAAPTVTFRARD